MYSLAGCGTDQPDTSPGDKQKLPREEVRLYFLDPETFKLVPVQREVTEAEEVSTRVEQIITELTDHPDTGPTGLVPDTLQVNSVFVDGQTIFVDVSEDLIGAAQGSSGEMMLLYSIVNSILENVPGQDYKLVHFLINGEMKKTIGGHGENSGHIAIRYPLGPRWNLVTDLER